MDADKLEHQLCLVFRELTGMSLSDSRALLQEVDYDFGKAIYTSTNPHGGRPMRTTFYYRLPENYVEPEWGIKEDD